jgi:hypothetical protein
VRLAFVFVVAACGHPPQAALENAPGVQHSPASTWSVFDRKGATWTLAGYQQDLTVEVTSVRMERGQHIAALKWTLHDKNEATNIDYLEFNEIVWGPGGAWLTTQDTRLDELLTRAPTVTEPPRPDEARDHYVRWEDTAKGRMLCVGEDRPEVGGFVCFAADGPVNIGGTWAPENLSFRRPGWEPR